MYTRRIIESAVGHRVAIEILESGDGIRLSRLDLAVGDAIILDQSASRILAAFLASALVVKSSARPPEEIGDAFGTVFTLHDEPAPLVRVLQGVRMLDLHSPGWEALRCEIEMVIPRLNTIPFMLPPQNSRH